MTDTLTAPPSAAPHTFLNYPFAADLDALEADIAILGIPHGRPYALHDLGNDQSRAPDVLRAALLDVEYTKNHHDFDLGGPLLDGRDVRVVDCGNVVADRNDDEVQYRNAEAAVRKILAAGATPISIGGDHGIPIPILRAMETVGQKITLVQVDAHIDWRDDVNGERHGFSSPIRRASEMDWIGHIVQIGIRGIGSARAPEVQAALDYGAEIITAYDLHDNGVASVLERIPEGPIYLTVDADGLDPAIMPGVMAQTPGGVTWVQMRALIHGLVKKGRVLGMDLVEIAPGRDVGGITMVHAERLICNFIGAAVRAGYYD